MSYKGSERSKLYTNWPGLVSSTRPSSVVAGRLPLIGSVDSQQSGRAGIAKQVVVEGATRMVVTSTVALTVEDGQRR